MANPEHLELLKQGVEVWNKWREENPEINPDLSKAELHGFNLHKSNFDETDLNRATLTSADLSGATLYATNLLFAALNDAILRDAIIIGIDLRHTSLSGADFTRAIIGSLSFGNQDLRKLKGIETIYHDSSSTIGIDTIYRSRGNIPEVFLRGCGVPDEFIIYMRSLVAHPIQFYTCFISFTEADDEFSEKLYNDLQAKGVRCWRWKEDAKWGKPLMHSIDEAVRLYDKLIVICSEQSLNSPAVIREIERALQKEDDLARQGKEVEVLFPIRLDDYIFTGWNPHRKADVIAKNIGDFRKWKDHDSYQKAFARLLRDLEADAD